MEREQQNIFVKQYESIAVSKRCKNKVHLQMSMMKRETRWALNCGQAFCSGLQVAGFLMSAARGILLVFDIINDDICSLAVKAYYK